MPDLKPGVVVYPPLHPRVEEAIPIIDRIFVRHAGRAAIITSARDGTHGENSWHYKGRALDLRSNDLSTKQQWAILAELRNELYAPPGFRWDIILEDSGTPNAHFHCELDNAPW